VSSTSGSTPAGLPPDDAAGGSPVDALVEEFLRRHRRDAGTTVDAFADAHPEHASELRELLPMLVALERVKRDRSSTGSRGLPVRALPPLERLGDFKIVREVGRGGMGVVFEAIQESLGRRVALKVLPQASLLSGNQLERFRREARIASQLHHSNIVPVFGSGETDGFHWYAMQFIAGQSLEQWRQTQAAAPPATSGAWHDRARSVARIGVQAASALHHAHAQGTLHRDIKPGNLLLETGNGLDEHLWVTDFGLAKALEAEGLTHTGDLLGTLQYMAPEQFAGHYDVRSEVYALGITLYELLVLRPAFAAKTRSELMELIRTRPPNALRQSNPEIPEDLAVVVERAIARDPRDRYVDAAALAADLDAFLADRPIAARRHNRAQLVWRWCRRNRALAALAAVTAVAILGAAVTGWVAFGIASAATAKAEQEARAKDKNLGLMRETFASIFDELVGRDALQAIEEDPDTGEQAVLARTVEPRDMVLLQALLGHYDRFAAENEDNGSLRVETARAYRRVGLIQTRLGNLDEGAAAFDKSLQRYLEVTGRDVTREIADLHVAYGQLERRRGRGPAAEDRFRRALDLLGPDVATDARALRFQRAEALFLSATMPGGDFEAGRRGPPDRSRDGPRSRADHRKDLAAARAIVSSLLEAEPANPEFLALHGRCLLASGRPRGGAVDQEREADKRAGLEIFRKLVAAHPENDQFALELCYALHEDRRGPARGRAEADFAADLDRLEEARQLADALLLRQPQFTDYQRARARVGGSLGRLLLRMPGDEATRAARRVEARAELRKAIELTEALLGRSAGADVVSRLDVISSRMALAASFVDAAELPEARREATATMELLRTLDRRHWRPNLALVTPMLDEFLRVLQRIGAPDLAAEFTELRTRLVPEDRGERNGSPNPPRRR